MEENVFASLPKALYAAKGKGVFFLAFERKFLKALDKRRFLCYNHFIVLKF